MRVLLFVRSLLASLIRSMTNLQKKYCWQAGMWDTMVLNPNDFPEVTFENSPMEVEIVIKK